MRPVLIILSTALEISILLVPPQALCAREAPAIDQIARQPPKKNRKKEKSKPNRTAHSASRCRRTFDFLIGLRLI